jgi:hypothetical protein
MDSSPLLVPSPLVLNRKIAAVPSTGTFLLFIYFILNLTELSRSKCVYLPVIQLSISDQPVPCVNKEKFSPGKVPVP